MKTRAFIEVIDDNKGTIRSLCSLYYSTSEDRKDAFQDIVFQLWKSYETFRGESEINTWVFRVAINTILSKKRKAKKSVSTEQLACNEQFIAQANADGDLELLHLLIQSLKDVDKAIVILHLEGYQNKEIAKMLNLSPSNVATRFNRLKSELKVKFKKQIHAAK